MNFQADVPPFGTTSASLRDHGPTVLYLVLYLVLVLRLLLVLVLELSTAHTSLGTAGYDRGLACGRVRF